jgi:hypothetical protein
MGAHHEGMFTPIDVESITRNALHGYGPEGPARASTAVRRYRWLRRQPAERPRSTPVVPAANRSRASVRSAPSSVR